MKDYFTKSQENYIKSSSHWYKLGEDQLNKMKSNSDILSSLINTTWGWNGANLELPKEDDKTNDLSK